MYNFLFGTRSGELCCTKRGTPENKLMELRLPTPDYNRVMALEQY